MLWLCSLALGADRAVLFLGNSYTSRNDLDVIVGALLAEGVPAWTDVETARISPGGWTFADHAGQLAAPGPNSHTEALLSGERAFDVVVLQEQSQTPGFDPAGSTWLDSLAAVEALDEAVEGHGAETLLYLTWGRRDGDDMNADRYPDFSTMQDHLTAGYLAYTDALTTEDRRVFVAPAGLAFRAVWASTNDPTSPESPFYALYAGDGSHPSVLGSMLVGYVFYAAMTGRTPVGLAYDPTDGLADGLPALAATADAVVLGDPFGVIPYPFAFSWDDYAAGAADVDLDGNGVLRPHVRVDAPASAAHLSLGDGVLWLSDTLSVGEITASGGRIHFDGGGLVVDAAPDLHLDAVTGPGGTLTFPELDTWDGFPVTVLTAPGLQALTVDVVVAEGYRWRIEDDSLIVDVGPQRAVAEERCGCASVEASASGWWLLTLAILVRRRRQRG